MNINKLLTGFTISNKTQYIKLFYKCDYFCVIIRVYDHRKKTLLFRYNQFFFIPHTDRYNNIFSHSILSDIMGEKYLRPHYIFTSHKYINFPTRILPPLLKNT